MSFPDRKITRRRAAQAIAASAFVLTSGGLWVANQERSPGRIVRDMRSNLGSEPLTYQQARDFVPHLAQLVASSPGAIRDGSDLSARTFVINTSFSSTFERDDLLDQIRANNDRIDADPISDQLERDYEVLFSPEEKAKIVKKISRNTQGFVTEDHAYIDLTKTNLPQNSHYHQSADATILAYQYDQIGSQVNCSPIEPGTQFTSTALHEKTHLDGMSQEVPLEMDVITAYANVEGKITGFPPAKPEKGEGTVQNFITDFLYNGNSVMFTALPDETHADYNMAVIATSAGIPYDSSYSAPVELSNFSKVLEQAGISHQELRVLHHESKLREFMIKVAAGAKNIDLPTEQSKLEFGVQRFLMRIGGPFSPHVMIWKDFEPYFEGIDVRGEQDTTIDQLRMPMFFTGEDSFDYFQRKLTVSCR